MNFYKTLSEYYDDIFPTNNNKIEFLEKHIKGNKVMDIGCGTGNHAIELSKKGYNVKGIDLNEDMIKIAFDKAKVLRLDIDFIVDDMLSINNHIRDKVDSVYSIGNSIVHLKDTDEILNLFKNVRKVLKNKGPFIFQIVNYDRILDKNIKKLPTINVEGKNIKFVRKYKINSDKIEFITTIELDNNQLHNSVILIPLTKNEINKFLIETGYTQINLWRFYWKTTF